MDESTFKDTSAKLRNRSWEMELLISGFVLVLLLPVPELIEHRGGMWLANLNTGIVQQLITIGYIIGLYGSRILIANLIIYLFLRGFWIGIVGLISAFPDGIYWSRISYQKTYQQYLERKTANTEAFVNILNKISSSVFSFSFLLVFLITAFFLSLLPSIILVLLINVSISSLPDAHWISQTVGIVIWILFLIYFSLALIFLVDFLTFGLIKRIRWRPFIKLYFPLYRFFRWLTLAPLYTPIYYTLISNVPKRTIAFVLISYLAVFFFFTNFTYSEEIFFPNQEGSYRLLSQHYEDKLEPPYPTLVPLIPSEYIEHDYLRLFLPYLVSDNDSLQQACPAVKVFREPGFATDMQVTVTLPQPDTTQLGTITDDEKNTAAALRCLADLYQVQLNDSPQQPPVFYFYRHEKSSQPGLITYLSIASLPSGLHRLIVKKRDYSSSAPNTYQTHYIPFVKEE